MSRSPNSTNSTRLKLWIRCLNAEGEMDVTAQIDLASEERRDLAKTLGCKQGDLASVLAPYATAALQEIVSMVLGQKVFTRGSDILEYRLLLLILYAFNGSIPSEQTVCGLFQMTA